MFFKEIFGKLLNNADIIYVVQNVVIIFLMSLFHFHVFLSWYFHSYLSYCWNQWLNMYAPWLYTQVYTNYYINHVLLSILNHFNVVMYFYKICIHVNLYKSLNKYVSKNVKRFSLVIAFMLVKVVHMYVKHVVKSEYRRRFLI